MENVFILGFILGITHALEPDHLLAVSTFISGKISSRQLALRGAVWGIGHAIMISVIGLSSYIFDYFLSDNMLRFFESTVGILLVILGTEMLIRIIKTKNHIHRHSNGFGIKDYQIHCQIKNNNKHNNIDIHSHKQLVPSLFKALFIGFVHGLAGAGLLMATAIASIGNNIELIVYYIFIFIIGSIFAKVFISLLICWPLEILESAYFKILRLFRLATASGACVLGVFILLNAYIFN